MQPIEYLIKNTKDMIERDLNALGAQGWNLVAVESYKRIAYIFSRPVSNTMCENSTRPTATNEIASRSTVDVPENTASTDLIIALLRAEESDVKAEMTSLGITYKSMRKQAMPHTWVVFGCSNIPNPLPSYIKRRVLQTSAAASSLQAEFADIDEPITLVADYTHPAIGKSTRVQVSELVRRHGIQYTSWDVHATTQNMHFHMCKKIPDELPPWLTPLTAVPAPRQRAAARPDDMNQPCDLMVTQHHMLGRTHVAIGQTITTLGIKYTGFRMDDAGRNAIFEGCTNLPDTLPIWLHRI